jgi:16S rRNA processing protein RimM
LGRIGAPFGVKGWVHVDSHTDPPDGLLNYPEWVLRSAKGECTARKVAEYRVNGDKLVVRLDGTDDRDGAAALRGAVIEIDREALPPPGERQYYQADLLGLPVRNTDGVELGTVRHFVDGPARPVVVVQGAQGREHWVPAVPRHLRRIDLAAGTILVDWPAELAGE